MSTDISVGETIPENVETEDTVIKVLNEMKKVQDESFKTDDICADSSQILPSSFKAIFNDVKNTIEQMLKDGKNTKVENLLQEVKGYSSVASCFGLIKALAYQVLDFYNNINKKEHSDRLNRINCLLEKVNAKLNVNSKKVEDLGEFLQRLLRQGYDSQKQESIEFGLQFDLIVVDLDSCAADLINAKNELNEGFASIKRYLTQRILLATNSGVKCIAIPAVIAARFAGPLLQLLGVCCASAGAVVVGLAVLGALVYIGYKLYQEITFARGVKDKYECLDARRESSEISLENLKKSLEAMGNAKKVMDAEENAKRLESEKLELEAEKLELETENMEKDEEIRRLKAELEALRINMQQ